MSETTHHFEFPVAIRTVTDTVAAGLNNEAKAIAFSYITEEFQPVSRINGMGNKAQGDPPIWEYSPRRIREYANTFVNVETIAKKYSDSKELLLGLTELGKKLARPLGGHLLLLSSETKPALFEIFGATQTKSERGIRSVENRIKIMRALTKERVIGLTDLDNKQNVGSTTIGDNTDQMHRAGLLNKQESRAGLPHALWVVDTPQGQIEITEHFGKVRIDVAEIINTFSSQNPGQPFSSMDIARALSATYGFADNPGKVVLMVAETLSNMFLAANPAIRRYNQTEGYHRQTLSVNNEQAAFFSRILKIIDSAAQGSDDFIEGGEQALGEILGHTPTVRQLIKKGYEHSQAKKQEESQLAEDLVLDIIAAAGHPVSRRQIVNTLAELGVNVHFESVGRYVKKHLANGKIKNKPHESGLSRYVIADDQTE